MYKTTIKEIGELVPAFAEEQLVILFGPTATSELRAIGVIHETTKAEENVLKVGRKLMIGSQQYEITKVGKTANKNFDTLGHISIYFKESEAEVLPGAVVVSPAIFPELLVGDCIEITA